MIQRAAFYSRHRGGNRHGANRHGGNRHGAGRAGFTLIEILVVLAIAAIISSVTLGGFNEMRAGNKRVACSTNLSQLYQAARLYAADEGGKFPYFEADCSVSPATTSGIGLWSLYTFPAKTDLNGDTVIGNDIALVGSPVERYLRSSKSLHCPSDEDNDQLYVDPATKDAYNPAFLSYQTCDTGSSTATYSAVRDTTPATPANDPDWKRQLLHFDGTDFVQRQPTGDTVVTYCLHHRGERNMDNVLFYDGSIQLIQMDQGGLTDWKRIPKDPQ